jgi:hypothetical protein
MLRVAMLCLLVAILSAAAYAGSIPIDPVIKIGLPPGDQLSITNPDFIGFSYIANDNSCTMGSVEGACAFENDIPSMESGNTIYSLSFQTNVPDVTCGILEGSPFSSYKCGNLPGGKGSFVEFMGGSLPSGGQFGLYFLPDSSGVGWSGVASFTGSASLTPTPEPGSMTLFLTGFGLLWVRRKVGSRKGHS